MKFLKAGLFMALMSIAPMSSADPAAEKEAAILLSTMGIEQAMTETMSQMLNIQLEQNPEIVPYRQVMLDFLNKHMSYESLKPELIRIYADTFTAAELREINAFYATKTGRKTIEKMPVLTEQGAQLGAARVQANIEELEAMIQAEAERIERLQKKDQP